MGYQPMVSRDTNYFVFPTEEWLMCPGCSRPISVYARSCTHCGRVVARYKHLAPVKWDNPGVYEVIEPKRLERPPLFDIDNEPWNMALMHLYGSTISVEQLRREVGLIDDQQTH